MPSSTTVEGQVTTSLIWFVYHIKEALFLVQKCSQKMPLFLVAPKSGDLEGRQSAKKYFCLASK